MNVVERPLCVGMEFVARHPRRAEPVLRTVSVPLGVPTSQFVALRDQHITAFPSEAGWEVCVTAHFSTNPVGQNHD